MKRNDYIDSADYIIKHLEDKLKELMEPDDYEAFAVKVSKGALRWAMNDTDDPMEKLAYRAMLYALEERDNERVC